MVSAFTMREFVILMVEECIVDKNTILIIEDDEDIAGFIELELIHEGYQVTIVSNGRQGLEMALTQPWNLILLDIMLPGMSGLEVCRRIRAISQVPIIMLTAKGEISDRVAGIDYGAEDYLVKPFAIEELLARIRGLLRRMAFSSSGNIIEVNDLKMNLDTREVTIANQPLNFTVREFELLRYLLENKNHVLTRETLLRGVWGYDFSGETNVVDVYIRYLRTKLDEKSSPPYIQTVRGVGYVLREL